ncbi:MAG: RecX family transcriptional regulator [Anaerolineae bacterium]|nr:RecX family transcriptional regulator [Anaerolineae bacterium]
MAGTITALVVQGRNKQRVSVYIDGEFAFGLAVIEALKLRKGQQLSDAEIARLKSLDEIEVAHEAALGFLSHRPRSVDEVRRRLEERQFGPHAIEVVVNRLQDVGLLDDEGFARYWVENRGQFSPRSIRALRQELRQKGVPDSDIAAVVETIDEVEAAYRAAAKQAGRHAGKDRQEFRKKVGGFLLRRGFGYSVIEDVVNRLWKEQDTLHDGNE